MASSYTTNKTLEKPANGDYVDTWNIPVNGDMNIIDQAFGGTTSLNATGGSVTLSVSQYRSLILQISGAISADVTYTIPIGVGGQWLVYDTTTTSVTAVVKIASGGGGTVATCQRNAYILVGSDGTNCWVVSSSANVPTGGGTNKAFYLNDITITDSYTVPVGSNAMTAGPVTINAGVTVTVSAGSYWSIV